MLRRRFGEALPWLPVCVTTFDVRDILRRERDSAIVWVSGFSQKTCFLAFIAAVQIGACQ